MNNNELLIYNLLNIGHETPWLEFKENNYKPDSIGEYISALSNSAALYDKDYGYLLWGVDNSSLSIV